MLEVALSKPLFVRGLRNVMRMQDGEIMLTFARRILALRDAGWPAVGAPRRDGPRRYRCAGRLGVVIIAVDPQEIFGYLSQGRDSSGRDTERCACAYGEGRIGRPGPRNAREGPLGGIHPVRTDRLIATLSAHENLAGEALPRRG